MLLGLGIIKTTSGFGNTQGCLDWEATKLLVDWVIFSTVWAWEEHEYSLFGYYSALTWLRRKKLEYSLFGKYNKKYISRAKPNFH